MIELISKKAAGGFLANYINLLDNTGYVKPSMVKRFLLYSFIIDFVEYMHAFIDEKDYNIIERLLGKIFANGGCLLPYPVFCVRRATLGETDYMTDYAVRITEELLPDQVEDDRISELYDIRTTNGYYGDKRYLSENEVVPYDWRDKEREETNN